MKGFRDFVLRGNVVDLAVAVVIGTAFTAIVTSIVMNVFTPLIGALFNANSLSTAGIVQIPTASGGHAQLKFGAVLASLINFVIIAAVVYFAFVLPINALLKRAFRRAQTQPAAPVDTPPTEADLLLQIRDLLAAQQGAPARAVAAQQVVDKG